MAKAPFFSIIIPMYNSEKYIKICIDSILAQTFQDFEVIIVDDASTDNSYKICKKLYGNNKKIRLLRQEKNQGAGVARNFAISNAHGEYVGFVDSDDAIVPDALAKINNTILWVGADVVHVKGYYSTTQDDGQPLNIRNAELLREGNNSVGLLPDNIPQRLRENWIRTRLNGLTVSNFCKRELLLQHKIKFPDCLSEDQVFALALVCFAKKFFMLNDAIYIYRKRGNHLNRAPRYGYGIESLVTVQNCIKKILQKIPELESNRSFKEECIMQTFEVLLRDYARPFYEGANISQEFDQKIYETMLPIFGENTTLVKYFFHGFNTMWRQANTFAQQNYIMREREKLLQQQKILLEKISQLINSNENLLYQNNLLAQQNQLLEQMGGLLEQHNRQLKQT